MARARCALLIVVAMAWPSAGFAQDNNYWLIKGIVGKWEYRIGSGEPRQLAGEYDALVPDGEVRCLEADVSRCELRYLTSPRSTATDRLEVPIEQGGRWVSLKTLGPPPPPLLPATSSDLVARYTRVTRAGGSRAASGCGGNLSLTSPECGDLVDVNNFRISWVPSEEGGTSQVSILVERVDGEPALFRGTAQESSGEFADQGLTNFLRKVQVQDVRVDLTVRVMAGDERSAVRLVHLPPANPEGRFESRASDLTSRDALVTTVSLLALAMDDGLWARVSEQARHLMKLASGSPPLLEYALVGLCQPGFEAERAALRRRISIERYTALCPSGAVTNTGAPQPGLAVPDAPGTFGEPAAPRTRLGIALLIGNWDYWNVPLNSVKSDLRAMSEVLETLGFEVTVRENLRSPRHFADALDDVLVQSRAGPDDVLFLYYSGHGVQLDGKAHLLTTGVSAKANVAEDVRDNAESAEELIAQMERAVPGTRILVVEACRDEVFSTRSTSVQAPRGGFAFQQDDVPNTYVMFANKPGLATPVRSDYGLMGPLTEALVSALTNPTGELFDAFTLAAERARMISPTLEPVLYLSRRLDPLVLYARRPGMSANRAKELIHEAEALYIDRAWGAFRATVDRGRALTSDPELLRRITSEVDFASRVMAAEKAEDASAWADAAQEWQAAGGLFPSRQWVTMKAAVAWLLADDLPKAVRDLAALTVQSDGELATQAQQMLDELLKDRPALEAEAREAASQAGKISNVEFEKIRDQE